MAKSSSKIFTWVAIIAAVASGATVLQIKAKVQDKKQDVELLAVEISEHRNAMHVLNAEWAYLTTPSSLQDKSLRFLALMPPSAEQIITNPSVIPYRPEGVKARGNQQILLPTIRDKKSSKDPSSKNKSRERTT